LVWNAGATAVRVLVVAAMLLVSPSKGCCWNDLLGLVPAMMP
jgi:hypothetical protein